MPRFTLRRARLSDIDALLELERVFPTDRLSRRSFQHLLLRAHADVWIGVLGDHLVANIAVLYRADSKRARIYSLVVAPAARGRGIAQTLLALAEKSARRRGRERLYLEVRLDNRAAIALYRKLGYQRRQRLPGFYEDGTDALRLEKNLRRERRP
ncbi:MAG: GNAT family N-acetyltransferase [Gammaproteobacteria bacterium]|nr:GNAT family N-acetyltransferase [Gammaproteobacteria bacterium]